MPVKPLKEQWLLYQQSRWDEDKYDMLVQPADVVLEWDASETTASVLKGVMPDVWPVIAGVSVNSALKIDRSEDSRFMVGCAPPPNAHMRRSLLSSAASPRQQLCAVPILRQHSMHAASRSFIIPFPCMPLPPHPPQSLQPYQKAQRSLQAAVSIHRTLHSSSTSR